MLEEKAEISVLLPTYRPDAAKLQQAVASILSQSFRRWELILYDDGSPESWRPLFHSLATLDPRVRYIRSAENRGVAYALNQCVLLARGTYLARMDDDDSADPERLALQLRFLKQHPCYQWVGANAYLVDESGIWGCLTVPERPLDRDFLWNSPYLHPSILFRKSVLLENGGYSTAARHRQCEDYELFLRLHQNGARGYNLQKPLLFYWESASARKKRRYPRRIREMRLRLSGFRALGLLHLSTLPYVVKPLAVGLLPSALYHKIRRMLKRK